MSPPSQKALPDTQMDPEIAGLSLVDLKDQVGDFFDGLYALSVDASVSG